MAIKPWHLLPPSIAHALSTPALKILTAFLPNNKNSWAPVDWQGLKFNNPTGIAGGVDKKCRANLCLVEARLWFC